MIDLFYPPSPQAFRRGRIIIGDASEPPAQPVRRVGRDPVKSKARQARYRARMRLDPARYAKKLAQNRAYHLEHREAEIAKMAARREAKRARNSQLPVREET